MQEPIEMLEDKRPITGIGFPGDPGPLWATVGTGGVTAIVAYGETGQMAYVPWLAVYEGEHLMMRINACHVLVYYGDAPEGNGQ